MTHVEAARSELEAALGYVFRAPELLLRALTHRSLAREQAAREHPIDNGMDEANGAANGESGDNERLEFLATRCSGWWLRSRSSGCIRMAGGRTDRVRAQLVSRQHVASVAETIGLGRYVRSAGLRTRAAQAQEHVLSNTMEAVIGAMFLDGGLEPVRAFARRQVLGQAAEQLAQELRSGAALGNYKSALQESFRPSGRNAGVPRKGRERSRPPQAVPG